MSKVPPLEAYEKPSKEKFPPVLTVPLGINKRTSNIYKKMIGLMRVIIVMGEQELSMMWKILNIMNILINNLYLMFSPLIMVKIILIIKVVNMLRKKVKSQIDIHPRQCMFTLQNIETKT